MYRRPGVESPRSGRPGVRARRVPIAFSAVGALVVLGALLVGPRPAVATFHLIKIVELFPGTDSQPAAQYVVLQMYSATEQENFVASHFVQVFDASGGSVGKFTFSQNLANGGDRSTILIATPEAESLFNINADLEMKGTSSTSSTPTPVASMPGGYLMATDNAAAADQFISLTGGAVCYDVIDCVEWGNFSGSASLPTRPEAIAGDLTLGEAMHRDLTDNEGGTTAFALAAPAPKNNAGQTGQLNETPVSQPTPTVTPGQTGNTPAPTATGSGVTPGPTSPITSSGMGGGGGGCAVVPAAQDSWGGVLVALALLALSARRRARRLP